VGDQFRRFLALPRREAVDLLFRRRTQNGMVQLFRYLFVGGLAAVVDASVLWVLNSDVGLHYLAAAAISFSLGTVVNYLLSVAWVFRSSGQVRQEFALFTLIGVGGLGLTEIIMLIGVDSLGGSVMVVKLVAMVLVVFWNFFLRRLLFNLLNRRAQRRRQIEPVPEPAVEAA
jgi:putative flippase GtrA